MAVTVSPSKALLTWLPLTLTPTQALSGHSIDDPTPAMYSAKARVAPPLRRPIGWQFRLSTSIVATHVSSSGVDMKSMPRLSAMFGFCLIRSFIFSKSIV